jgi:hypothetical protein
VVDHKTKKIKKVILPTPMGNQPSTTAAKQTKGGYRAAVQTTTITTSKKEEASNPHPTNTQRLHP